MPQIKRISPRFGTALEWTVADPVLDLWEIGEESDTGLAKRGDGVTAWTSLPYWGASIATLQSVIANDPNATSVPEFQGGANVGDGTSALMLLKDGLVDSTLIQASAGGLQIKHSVGINMLTPYMLLGVTDAAPVSSMSTIEWNASTNTPALLNTDTLAGNKHYRVSVAGTHDFGAGPITFGVRDIVGNLNGEYYKKVDNNQAGGSTAEVATYVATNTGTVTLDCDTFDSTYRILTGNTDFQFSNTPASGETFVKTVECITTSGETLTFTTADEVIGTFVNDDTTINLININFANYPTVGLRVTVAINS